MDKKNKYFIGLIGILILLLIWLGWRIENLKTQSSDDIVSLRKSIIESDSLRKEADGRYAKLVDYYTSQSDLNKELKNSNQDLYNVIKKQDERILSLTTAVITLQGKVSQGTGQFNPQDSSIVNLDLFYPENKDWFIHWGGSVDSKTAFYNGRWEFGKLPLQIVLTEEKRGLWKTRVVGPEWLIVDSLTVNSLPPEQYTELKKRKLQYIVGGNYTTTLGTNAKSIGVGLGVSWNDKHNIILTANTNSQIGFGYYYKFQSFKKRK